MVHREGNKTRGRTSHKKEPDVYQAQDDIDKALGKIGLGGATVATWHANTAVTQVDNQWT